VGRTTINFAEVEGGFEAVPEGTYDVTIEKVDLRDSKSSEHDYLNWEFKIVGDDYEGQRLWMITSLSPRALFRLKDVFEALGVLEDEMTLDWDDDVEITNSSGPMLLEPDVIGMSCKVVVHNEVYEGKERNRVEEVLGETSSSNGAGKSSGSAKKASSSRASAKKSGSGSRRALR
jgi:hypothetical protein